MNTELRYIVQLEILCLSSLALLLKPHQQQQQQRQEIPKIPKIK